MAQKDFYKTLGVAETSTPEEIKKAYRKLAKKYHPDATGGDKAKEAKFKEISEAYDTLSDVKRRGDYDQQRKSPFGAGFGGGFGGFGGGGFAPGSRAGTRSKRRMDIDIDDFLRGAGFEGFGGRTSSASSPPGTAGRRVQKGADLQTTLDLTLPEAALGVEKTLVLEPQTGGRKLTLRIPAGVDDGETIKVPGQGRPGLRGGPTGDLLVQVHIEPHPTFRRKGVDIETDLNLRIDEAVLGVKAELATLEGKVSVAIPAGTSSGQRLRLRGKGAADRKGGRGDLYAVIQIQVPKNLSEEAQALIKQFGELTRPKTP